MNKNAIGILKNACCQNQAERERDWRLWRFLDLLNQNGKSFYIFGDAGNQTDLLSILAGQSLPSNEEIKNLIAQTGIHFAIQLGLNQERNPTIVTLSEFMDLPLSSPGRFIEDVFKRDLLNSVGFSICNPTGYVPAIVAELGKSKLASLQELRAIFDPSLSESKTN
jgi:hypothetical protein